MCRDCRKAWLAGVTCLGNALVRLSRAGYHGVLAARPLAIWAVRIISV